MNKTKKKNKKKPQTVLSVLQEVRDLLRENLQEAIAELDGKRESANMIAPTQEFIVGKHAIGYMNTRFEEFVKQAEPFQPKSAPTPTTLPRPMTDSEIESELSPGICTLGDVLAFLKDPPEGSKDGFVNLFYFPAFVVCVYWHGGCWGVNAWERGGVDWHAGRRVFSPAN